MSSVGIICEYNPFHEGHKYHIQKAREMTGADTVVALMNGDFVQRGEPAVVDKYTRAGMALSEGADMVFELPVRYGLSSARDFAHGAVMALHSLTFVDYFCFGSEGADESALIEAGHFFAEEPETYRQMLKQFLREGMSYPAARERAFAEGTGAGGADLSHLFEPNNILGVEYIRAAARLNTSMKPVVVRRKGLGYHDEAPNDVEDGEFLSATAIRKRMENGEFVGIPEGARKILLSNYGDAGEFMKPEDFWSVCFYAIRDKWESLESIKDISEDLANAFRKNWYESSTLEEFARRCKGKNTTMSRVKRCIFQTLIGVEKEVQSEEYIPSLRLLGMRQEAAGKLKEVKNTVILGRLAKDMERLGDTARQSVYQDIKASDIYRGVSQIKSGKIQPDEYKRPVIII